MRRDFFDIEEAAPLTDDDGHFVVLDTSDIEDLDTPLLYLLNTDHGTVGISLLTVLQFMRVAEDHGFIEKLPESFWQEAAMFNGLD